MTRRSVYSCEPLLWAERRVILGDSAETFTHDWGQVTVIRGFSRSRHVSLSLELGVVSSATFSDQVRSLKTSTELQVSHLIGQGSQCHKSVGKTRIK